MNKFLRRSFSEDYYCYTETALVAVAVAALDDDIDAAVDYRQLVVAVAVAAWEREANNYYSFQSDAVHSVVASAAAEVRTDYSCSSWNGPLAEDRHFPVDGPLDCRANY